MVGKIGYNKLNVRDLGILVREGNRVGGGRVEWAEKLKHYAFVFC
jgi:hypothetical protein